LSSAVPSGTYAGPEGDADGLGLAPASVGYGVGVAGAPHEVSSSASVVATPVAIAARDAEESGRRSTN
jgi:hypothetical protein